MNCRLRPSGIGAIVRLCLADETSECREVSCARPQSPKVALNQSRELYSRLLSDTRGPPCTGTRVRLLGGVSQVALETGDAWLFFTCCPDSQHPQKESHSLGLRSMSTHYCHAPRFILLVYDLLHLAIAGFNKSTKQRKQWMKLIL